VRDGGPRAHAPAGPPGRRHGAGDDARGGRDVPRRAARAVLPRAAHDPLPLPDEGARRGAPARRAAAHARVHHEGRLHLRPRRGGPGRELRGAAPGLSPGLRALRAALLRGRVRRGDDGRVGRPRVHGAVRGGGERGRAGAGLRGQRRGGVGRAAGRARPARRALRGAAHARADDGGAGRGLPRGPGRQPRQGLPRRDGGAGLRRRVRPRRPPDQRDQAHQRPRRALPRGPGGRAARAGGLPRAARGRAGPLRRRGDPGALRRGRQPARPPPGDRGGGGRAARRADRGARGHRRRASHHARAGHRGGQHLQARHPLLRAPGRDVPRRERQGAPHRHGLLRHRPRADRRRGGGAVRRRPGDLLAARDRPVAGRARGPRQGRRARARGGRAGLRRAARGRPGRPLRRPRRGAGGEVHGRRAPRGPAAPDPRQALPGVRDARGPAPARARGRRRRRAAGGRRRGGGSPVARPPL
ncbi:MAG: Prolyl-tRNA synthetase, bacterial type, partial [uncultured Solirubrobacteraceae bacterium]